MAERRITLELLQTIAEANGTSIDSFLIPVRRAELAAYTRPRAPYRHAAMLPRFFKAYFALPGAESRIRALRMMEAMAARARAKGDAAP